MTMYDWIVFVRLVSPYCMHNAGVPEEVLELWTPVRQAAVYFLDYKEGQHQEGLIDKAQNLLTLYSWLAEQKVPDLRLNTVQLHNCVVHLPQSVRKFGPSIFRTEFWIERLMQVMKRITKYRTMCSPELVAVAAWLLKRALHARAATHPELLQLWAEVDPDEARFVHPDSFDVHGNAITSKSLKMQNGPESEKVRARNNCDRHVFMLNCFADGT
jgi:hypothetical protein